MFLTANPGGIPFALLSWAVLSITTGLASILNATVPLFGALVAWAWLKDKPTGSRLLGLAIGFIGVALLAWGKASFKPGGTGWAVLACLLATLCYGIAASFTKRHREALQATNSHALLVPSADPHLSEYLPGHWQGREWLSGFTGSMGTLVVARNKAALFNEMMNRVASPLDQGLRRSSDATSI